MREFVPSKIYGIIGDPLGHSLSPLLHTTAFRILGIPAVLVPWRMPSEALPRFIDAMRLLDIHGACVTIPHKENIIPLLDGIGDAAAKIGSVNLLYRKDGAVLGDNTDVHGFIAPMRDMAISPATTALVLGSGGSARSAVVGLGMLGIQRVHLAGRNESAVAELAREFGVTPVSWKERKGVGADIVVNTTPLGMLGDLVGETPYAAEWFGKKTGLAYDIIYTPVATRFLREARAAGWETRNGLPMFIEQADRQFFTWTEQHLPEEAVAAVKQALALREAGS